MCTEAILLTVKYYSLPISYMLSSWHTIIIIIVCDLSLGQKKNDLKHKIKLCRKSNLL